VRTTAHVTVRQACDTSRLSDDGWWLIAVHFYVRASRACTLNIIARVMIKNENRYGRIFHASPATELPKDRRSFRRSVRPRRCVEIARAPRALTLRNARGVCLVVFGILISGTGEPPIVNKSNVYGSIEQLHGRVRNDVRARWRRRRKEK